MENILTAEKEVLLCSSLSEEMFAKTKFSSLMYEKGFIVEPNDEGKYKIFTEWSFSGTKTIDDSVYFTGTGFYGNAISRLPETSISNNEIKKIIYHICEAYSYAQEQNIILPNTGPSSILYDGKRFLFIPQKTFDRSCANLGKTIYDMILDPWRDASLSGNKAVNFTKVVYIYFALTKNLPYPPGTEIDKSISIVYKNFLPIEFCINGINKTLAENINSSLSGKNDTKFFPLDLLFNEFFRTTERKKILSDELFEKAAIAYKQKQLRQIKNKKLFNRWYITSIIILSAILVISIFAISITKDNNNKPSTIGLSSEQTTEVFYTGIHKMDTDYMLAAAKNCIQAQGYISRVPQIYVTSQMKAAYNFESGMSTPENWMFFEPDSTRSYSHTIYGITNFTIDGNPSTLNEVAPTKKNHPKKITRIDNKRLDDFSKAHHKVHYYLVHTVDNMIEIEEFTTIVNLKYVKDKWQIFTLDEVSSKEVLSPLTISLDLKDSLEKNNNDIINAVLSIKNKYNWLPTKMSMEEEKTRLDSIGY